MVHYIATSFSGIDLIEYCVHITYRKILPIFSHAITNVSSKYDFSIDLLFSLFMEKDHFYSCNVIYFAHVRHISSLKPKLEGTYTFRIECIENLNKENILVQISFCLRIHINYC